MAEMFKYHNLYRSFFCENWNLIVTVSAHNSPLAQSGLVPSLYPN